MIELALPDRLLPATGFGAQDLTSTVRYLASLKNVRLPPEQMNAAVNWVEKCLHDPQMPFVDFSNAPITDPATKVADRILDIFATVDVMHYVVAMIEGNVSPDSGMIVKRAEQEAPRFTGGVPFYRWPEPRETFRLHYRDVPWAPVVTKADDGTITTNYMRNDVLHRDPEQGPAVHQKTPFGERQEYWVDGKLHRPHAQGPAIIDSHLLGENIAVIEYFQDGQWHRPAADGPAFSAKDHAGQVMAEIYYEHGQMHRDPKQGPARYFRNSVHEEWEYVVRGAHHRDATDGPAFIDSNFEGRGVRREEYYRDGQLHRDPKKGPALIVRNEGGLIVEQEYWVNGERMEVSAPPAGNRAGRRKAKSHKRKGSKPSKTVTVVEAYDG